MDKETRRRLGEALDFAQMKAWLPDTNVVAYPELKKFKSLKSLLGKHNRAVVLYLLQPTYGHYTLIQRRPDGVELWDSLGVFKPEGELPLTIHPERTLLLKMILKENPKAKVYYNDHPLQTMDPRIKTCGRHVIMRAMFPHLTEDEYAAMLKRKGNPDVVVAKAIETLPPGNF